MALLLLMVICAFATTINVYSYGKAYSDIPEFFVDSSREEKSVDILAKIGVILPYNDVFEYSMRKFIPTIGLSIKYLKDRSIMHGFKFHFFFGDSNCSDINGPLAALDFYGNKGVNCFIGPVCDYTLSPVSLYASYWKIPIVSPGGLHYDFGNNKLKEYTTLTRVGSTLEYMSMIFLNIMKHFGWKKMNVMYEQIQEDQNPICHSVNGAMINTASKTDINGTFFRIEQRRSDYYEAVLTREVGTKISGKSNFVQQAVYVSIFMWCFVVD